jgi:hypothetical protein
MLSNVTLGSIKKQSKAWPRGNTLVTCDVTENGKTFESSSISIEEYNLVNMINKLVKKYKVSQADKLVLIKAIDTFGNMQYQAGSDDEYIANSDACI